MMLAAIDEKCQLNCGDDKQQKMSIAFDKESRVRLAGGRKGVIANGGQSMGWLGVIHWLTLPIRMVFAN